jgi:Flp pilus assembly protein TadG
VEFALLAPLMVIILAGIIDFGMSLDHRIAVQHAVREGARYAAVQSDCALIQQRTVDRAGGIFDTADVSVRYFDANGAPVTSAAAGDSVKVTAPFDWTFPLVGGPIHIGSLTIGVGPIHSHVPASARLEMAVPGAGGCGP